MRPRLVILAGLVVAAWLAAPASTPMHAQRAAPRRPAAGPPATAPTPPSAVEPVLGRYCIGCHSSRVRAGGFVLDPATLSTLADHAGTWEKVVRRLRDRAMPPAGAPRPDDVTYESLASSIEASLDRHAAAVPQVGRLPLARRLTRTEYQNAIRDLLALDALPREASIDYLLPADNSSSGFDTIADLLFVSPSTMERYLGAAQKISRLAVGDPTLPVLVNIHPLDPEHPQDERVDDLSFGTRGGLAVRSDFPVNGTYTVKVELAGAPRDSHDLEVTVDGRRAAIERLAAAGGGRGGGAARPQTVFEFPLAIDAGPRLVGVAFLQRTEARDEATLRPRMRSRGTQPAIARVTISGPHRASAPGDSPSRRRIFLCRPATAADEDACATRILSTLARRAYRRPVTDVDLDDLRPFFREGRTTGGFDNGIQRALERLLVSPQFLFRIERPVSGPAGTIARVSDLELASRLSFFLWSSIPDDDLLEAAAAGRLSDPAVLESQVRRMLADRRASALVTNFAAQWLFLRDIQAKLPDEVLFQDFDETLRTAMQRETELFVESVFRDDRSVLELVSANYTFLNERLAKHYGVPNVRGSHFRRVTFPDGSVRGGLLGQGSILTITSYSTRTSPVLRGKWVLENLLSAAPPPPPPDVPSLKTAGAVPGETLTMRDAMARHRASPACAGCHAQMDPIGFALERFDAVGRWRDRDGGQLIDGSGVLPDGTTFDGVAGLKRALLRHPDQFARTLTERLLMYALGRNLQYHDAPVVRAVLREGAARRFPLSSLVLGVVRSRPFLMREAGPLEP